MLGNVKFLLVVLSWLSCVEISIGQPSGGSGSEGEGPKPLRALLITGGCCHDYPRQIEIITNGLNQRIHISWEVFHASVERDRRLAIYQTDEWTDGYDVVVHNECYGTMDDKEVVERIVRGHSERGIPAVVIHCSMHSYRHAKTDEWRKLVGVTSMRHEAKNRQLDIVCRDTDHPIMQGFPPNWRTPNGELYMIERTWPDCHVLATTVSVENQQDQPVIWTNHYGKARVFGITLGHHNETMMEKAWQDVVSRGLLWACDKLQADGTPQPGYEADL